MEISKENYESVLPLLKLASKNLKGSSRRIFLGHVALSLGYGGRSLVSKTLGINRETLNKGIREIESSAAQVDRFTDRGRKPLEETNPGLLSDIKDIIDRASQIDSKFTSTRLYTRLTVKEVRKQLLSRGYADSGLPTDQTIWNKMHSLGYKRKKVAKTKPLKKLKETNAIFAELAKTNKQADADETTLRISFDAKNKVNIGNFSRGGKKLKQGYS